VQLFIFMLIFVDEITIKSTMYLFCDKYITSSVEKSYMRLIRFRKSEWESFNVAISLFCLSRVLADIITIDGLYIHIVELNLNLRFRQIE